MNQAFESRKRKFETAKRDWEDESRKRRRLRKRRPDDSGDTRQHFELDELRKQPVVIETEDGTRIFRRQPTAECTISVVCPPTERLKAERRDGAGVIIATKRAETHVEDDDPVRSLASDVPAIAIDSGSRVGSGLSGPKMNTDAQEAHKETSRPVPANLDLFVPPLPEHPSRSQDKPAALNPSPSGPPNPPHQLLHTVEDDPFDSKPPSPTHRPPVQKVNSWLSHLDPTAEGAEWARLPPKRPYEADQWHAEDLAVGESATVMAWRREGEDRGELWGSGNAAVEG